MVKKFISENKSFVISFTVFVAASVVVLVFIKDEVTRFTFIMPLFAGFILYNILTLPLDEENGEEQEGVKRDKTIKKTGKKASTKK